MTSVPARRTRRSSLLGGLAASILLLSAGSASGAGSGSIDHVEVDDGALGVLFSISGLPQDVSPDLDSLAVTVDGEEVEASAEIAADAATTVRRTAVLAMDVSSSMRGQRFAEAKLAAKTFMQTVSDDVYVGIVSFAGKVQTVQPPTLDRAETLEVVDGLALTRQTRLYDGVLQAVKAAGSEGQRSILVLSDGKDTSPTALEDITSAIEAAGVKVDVVALAQAQGSLAPLESLAAAGNGNVLSAADPKALSDVFAAEAQTLADQVLVTADLTGIAATEGTVSVSIDAGGETYNSSAFAILGAGEAAGDPLEALPPAVSQPPVVVSKDMMFVGLAGAALGVLVLLLLALGVFTGTKKQTLEDRLGAYSRGKRNATSNAASQTGEAAPSAGLAGSAVDFAEKALAANTGLAASVGARLEAAGMGFKAAEWLLLHTGIAFGTALIGLLLSGGSLLVTALSLILGSVLPWLYLGYKKNSRVKAFNGQLADTLQLISGSLSAGLSLAQAVDTVVRQGSEPMTSEFKRALVEARLGVSIEDSMESVALRMHSDDFKWVVMAVRIQREVGGNLAEVLGTVAATIRERDYLKRQVKSLSAEGKLSAYILCGLPIVVAIFLMITQPGYLAPMLETPLGWALIGASGGLMGIGIFWMSRLIKLEV